MAYLLPCLQNHQIRSLVLYVDLVGSRRTWPTHVGCFVGPDGFRRIKKDRLDDHRDDQGASDRQSDAFAEWNDGENDQAAPMW